MHGHALPTFGRSNADRSRGIDTHTHHTSAEPLLARRLDRDTYPQNEGRWTCGRNRHRRSERHTRIRLLLSTYPLHQRYCSRPSKRYKPGRAAVLLALPHCTPPRCMELESCDRYCRLRRHPPSSAAFLCRSATCATVASAGEDSWSTSAPCRHVRCSEGKVVAQMRLAAIWKRRLSGQTMVCLSTV